MSVTDFVFGGSPAPNTAPRGGNTQVPQYLSDSYMKIANDANAVYNQPYQTNPNPMVAPPSPNQTSAWDATKAAQGQYMPQMKGALEASQGIMPQANQTYGQALQTTQGGLGRFTGNNVVDYMNPYVQNVIQAANTSAMQNYNENVAPSLNAQFISAGQPDSLGHMAQAGRNVRDLQNQMLTTDAALYGQAYDTAEGAFSADQNRQLQGGMNQAQIAANQANTGINAANTTAGLAKDAQGMNYTDIGALNAVGNQQQGLAQQGLDATNQQWNAQNNYQRDMLNQWSNLLSSVNGGASTNAVGYGYPQPTGPSPFNSAGVGMATGMAGWGGGGNARGGLALAARYKRGGLVRKPRIPEWLARELAEALEAA